MLTENNAGRELSVIVVVLTGDRESLRACLSALDQQLDRIDAEVIVPCDVNQQHLLSLAEEIPAAQFVRIDGSHTFAELRTIGIKRARGRIIALTEDHCTPAPGWVSEIVTAHKSSHAAVGGVVEKKEPDTALNWAFYLADYLRYMNPVSEGPANNLTDCNVSYKRAALNKVSNIWSHEFHEPEVHGALQTHGDVLWLNPRMLVYQQRSLNLRAAIFDRYAFGRLFSSTRSASLSGGRRLLFSLLSFLLPAVLVGRVASHVFSKRRHAKEFIRALPCLLLISSVWSAGEFLGYVTGRAGVSLTPNGFGSVVRQDSQEALI